MIRTYIFISSILLLFTQKMLSQQSHSLFLMHQLPESNLMNPAVPISCKWHVGMPVLSSVHLNYGNSSFTYKQLFQTTADGQIDVDGIIDQQHWRNYAGLEFHTQLFALGYRDGDYSLMFTINEKANLPLIYPKEPFMLMWDGNSQFEGQDANFNGTGAYLSHYREYAISASKYKRNGTYIGARAKLLFGKTSIAPRSSNIGLTTNETSFDLHFHGDIEWHSSAPVIIDTADNHIENITYDENIGVPSYLLNRKNPGFALDFGIIYPLNRKVEISASILDLGFIRWKSNLNTISGSGEFYYNGPLGDEAETEGYMEEVANSLMDSLEFEVSNDKYFSYLSPRILVGGTYRVNNKVKAGAQAEATIVGSKVMPSITLSGHYLPANYFSLMASYSVQYYSLKTLGVGFVLGRNPIQFYAITDNILGAIYPLRTRNVNLRFGLNINFGCNIREKNPEGKGMLQGRCYWLEQDIKRNHKKHK